MFFVWISGICNELSYLLHGFSRCEASQGPPADLPEATGTALVEPLGSLGTSGGAPGEPLGTLGASAEALGVPEVTPRVPWGGLGDTLWSSWVTVGHPGTPLESPRGSLSENHKKPMVF